MNLKALHSNRAKPQKDGGKARKEAGRKSLGSVTGHCCTPGHPDGPGAPGVAGRSNRPKAGPTAAAVPPHRTAALRPSSPLHRRPPCAPLHAGHPPDDHDGRRGQAPTSSPRPPGGSLPPSRPRGRTPTWSRSGCRRGRSRGSDSARSRRAARPAGSARARSASRHGRRRRPRAARRRAPAAPGRPPSSPAAPAAAAAPRSPLLAAARPPAPPWRAARGQRRARRRRGKAAGRARPAPPPAAAELANVDAAPPAPFPHNAPTRGGGRAGGARPRFRDGACGAVPPARRGAARVRPAPPRRALSRRGEGTAVGSRLAPRPGGARANRGVRVTWNGAGSGSPPSCSLLHQPSKGTGIQNTLPAEPCGWHRKMTSQTPSGMPGPKRSGR